MSSQRHEIRESTLTTPSDRNPDKKFQINTGAPALTPEQTAEAVKDLNVTSYVERYMSVERNFADPVLELQRIGLISFVPARGAKPNDEGIYGFAKLRGNFATETEANARAEYLIRNHDSYHQIYHTYVGRPFPLTTTSDFSKEVFSVDIQRQAVNAISDEVKRKREKEQKDIEEIKDRERQLLEDVKREEEPTDDHYTTLRVKKAQLAWTYLETHKKLKQMCVSIAKARKEIEDLDEKYPELKNKYFNKYMDARKQAGLSTDRASVDTSFMKYLVEDAVIPEVDAEYKKLYETNEDI
jgi:hypothetical protein